jgi:hypothetical protein
MQNVKHDDSVDKVAGYELDSRGLILDRDKDLSPLSKAKPVSYPVGTRGALPRGEGTAA